jgi:hypothetical protein
MAHQLHHRLWTATLALFFTTSRILRQLAAPAVDRKLGVVVNDIKHAAPVAAPTVDRNVGVILNGVKDTTATPVNAPLV